MKTIEETTVRTPKGIFLGQKVKDVVSGVVGAVLILSETANGAWHVTIQPSELNKDGEVKSAKTVAEARIQQFKESFFDEPTFRPKQFQMFDRVKARLSGLEGEIRSIDYHLTGCLQYTLKSGKMTEWGSIAELSFDADELRQLLSAGPPKAQESRSPESTIEPMMRERLASIGAPEDLLHGCPVDC